GSGTFVGVSCPSTSACTAVGTGNGGLTLAEYWNGSSWAIQATPNVAAGARDNLTDVSCASATACTAVGYYTDGSGRVVTLALVWNGTKWAVQPTPNPTSATMSFLTAVSCPSTTPCTAVGSYDNTSGQQVTLAEHWDGVSWVIQTTPNTDGATASVLDGVSCPAMTSCTAVAYSRTSAGVFVTLAEVWDGSSW